MVFEIPILAKVGVVGLVYLLHHLSGKWLKGLVLSLALWILIPGVDEAVTMPLLAKLGILHPWMIIAYYALGIFLLLIALIIL